MPTEFCRVTDTVPASPEQIYEAWLDGKRHAAMTGGAGASSADAIGVRFTAWDGYIEGTTLQLEPGRRIVQAWRTTEFPTGSPDSRLEIVLDAHPSGGTTVMILHSEIPEGQGRAYEEGWQDHYLTPMKEYFAKASSKRAASRAKPAKGRAKKAAKKAKKPARRASKARRGRR